MSNTKKLPLAALVAAIILTAMPAGAGLPPQNAFAPDMILTQTAELSQLVAGAQQGLSGLSMYFPAPHSEVPPITAMTQSLADAIEMQGILLPPLNPFVDTLRQSAAALRSAADAYAGSAFVGSAMGALLDLSDTLARIDGALSDPPSQT